jgi:hypothetical protein
LIWLLFLLPFAAKASSDEAVFDPVFVDSLLKAQEQIMSSPQLPSQLQSAYIAEEKVWDLQTVNPPQYLAAIYPVVLLVLLLFVLLKFFYRNFFEAGLLGLPNDKVFLLHHRGNKFTEDFPWIAFFILRILLIALAIQYGVYFISGKPEAAGLVYFGIWVGVVAAFYTLRFSAEWIVQTAMGFSKQFKVYYMQHLLITGWLSLPALLIILVLYTNFSAVGWKLYAGILVGIFLLVGLFSLLRSLLLWSSELRSHVVYFFIYFCTFKILPYALVIKWISERWVHFE